MEYATNWPSPVAGETTYSWVARCHIYSGYPSFRGQILKSLALDGGLACTEFPGYIRRLAELTGFDEQWIVHSMTGVGYYRPFLTEQQYQMLIAEMLAGHSASIQTRFGMTANRLSGSADLYYCPCCVDIDCAQRGFPFWHVEHQLTGVTCCPLHCVKLKSLRRIRSQAAMPPKDKCDPANSIEIAMSQCILSAFVSNEGLIPKEKCTAIFKSRLLEMGMLTQCGRIRERVLAALLAGELKVFASNPHYARIQLDIEHGSFPQSMFYHPQSLHHPLKYFWLIHCLFGSWEQFINALKNFQITTEHRARLLVTKSYGDDAVDAEIIKLLQNGMSMRKIHEATQKCVIYIKKLASLNQIEIDRRPSRIFKPEQQAILNKLIAGISAVAIAKEFQISIAAVEQILSKRPDIVESRKSARYLQKREECRLVIANFCKEHPDARQKDIRNCCGSAYIWLYKHDRDWFREMLPKAVPRQQRYLRYPHSK